MKLRELFEAPKQGKHVTFCFGRMNPPHYGHGSLIKKVAQVAGRNDWFIFVSKSQDPKKNPLPYNQKLAWLHALFPSLGNHLIPNPEIKTFLQAAAYLYAQGYTSATFVAGDEDMALMQPTLEKYNGVESKHGVYKFQPLQFVENPRETSATSARQAAISGDEDAFVQATQVPSDLTVNGLTLFQTVRQGMGLLDQEEPEPKEKAVAEGATRKPLRKSTKQSMSNLSRYDTLDNNNHPYLAYRFGIALAGSPTEDMPKSGPLGSSFTMADYSDADTEIRKGAEKVMGVKQSSSTGKGSEELPHTNTVSPTAKPKKNKYGV